MSVAEIGCCGAYCGTCRVLREGFCKGCKLGYDTGERDLKKAKCTMKVCCVGKGLAVCALCTAYPTCDTIRSFLQKNGYKYKKYRQASEYIREHGCEAFLRIADHWKDAYGKFD